MHGGTIGTKKQIRQLKTAAAVENPHGATRAHPDGAAARERNDAPARQVTFCGNQRQSTRPQAMQESMLSFKRSLGLAGQASTTPVAFFGTMLTRWLQPALAATISVLLI
jgi:hypothetical protein